MENKTINVSYEVWKKLMKYKLELGCKNLDDLLERILKISTLSNLNEG